MLTDFDVLGVKGMFILSIMHRCNSMLTEVTCVNAIKPMCQAGTLELKLYKLYFTCKLQVFFTPKSHCTALSAKSLACSVKKGVGVWQQANLSGTGSVVWACFLSSSYLAWECSFVAALRSLQSRQHALLHHHQHRCSLLTLAQTADTVNLFLFSFYLHLCGLLL